MSHERNRDRSIAQQRGNKNHGSTAYAFHQQHEAIMSKCSSTRGDWTKPRQNWMAMRIAHTCGCVERNWRSRAETARWPIRCCLRRSNAMPPCMWYSCERKAPGCAASCKQPAKDYSRFYKRQIQANKRQYAASGNALSPNTHEPDTHKGCHYTLTCSDIPCGCQAAPHARTSLPFHL